MDPCAGPSARGRRSDAGDKTLEDLPAKLAELDRQVAQQLETYIAAVNKEGGTKRLNEAYVESLRSSGRTAVENAYPGSGRARLPVERAGSDNPAASQARDILESGVASLAAQRIAALTGAANALRSRIAALAEGNPTAEEFKALGDRIDDVHKTAFPRAKAGEHAPRKVTSPAPATPCAGSSISWRRSRPTIRRKCARSG